MLTTSARLLRLLSLLQSRRNWSGKELSERLEIDARTVRRDVDRLRELGYPVQASAGLGGGYKLGAGSSMPPVLLNDDETVAVAVALRAAAGSIGNMEEATISLLAKLDQLLPARLRKRASALHSVTVSVRGPTALPSVDLLTSIATACRDYRTLRISYSDREGRASARIIEPLRLAHTGRRWYVVAWDQQRADWRTFRVDRIERLISVGSHFIPRELPEDAASYVARSIAHVSYRHRVRLKVVGSVELLAEQIPKWCGVLEANDEHSCVLRMGADSIESLFAMMAVAGVDFEVLDPPELVPELKRVAERMARGLRIVNPASPG